MVETRRKPVPRNDDGELDTATAFLSFARELTEEQLRRVLVASGTSLPAADLSGTGPASGLDITGGAVLSFPTL